MSVVNGSLIILMLFLLLYTVYRLFRRKSILMTIPICAQIFALAIAVLSFVNDVEALTYIEAVFVLFGLVIPLVFLTQDYLLMIKRIKRTGSYEGLVEKVDVWNTTASSLPIEGINSLAGDIQINSILRDLQSLPKDIQKNIRKQLNYANTLNKQKGYIGPYYIYETVSKIIDTSFMLYYNLGCICYRLNKYEEALDGFKRSLELSKDAEDEYKRDIYYNIANTYFMLGKYYEAAKSYEIVLQLFGDDLKTIENLSFTYVRNAEIERGIDLLMKTPVNNDTYRAHFISGKLLYEAERYIESEEEFRKCIVLNTRLIEPKAELAIVLTKLKKLEAAIDIYNEILSIDPDNYEAWNNKSKLCTSLNRWAEAAEGYREAVRLKPDNSKNYYNYAVALEESGKTEASIEAYKKAINISPDFAEAYNNLGIALSVMGKTHEALEVYEAGIKKNKNDFKLYFNMGMNHFEAHRYSEASKAYKKALEIRPGELETYYYLGAALTEMRYYNDAIDAYKKALDIKPSDWELYYSIAAIYAMLGRYDISLENLKKAIELNSGICDDIVENRAFDGMRGRNDFKEIVAKEAV